MKLRWCGFPRARFSVLGTHDHTGDFKEERPAFEGLARAEQLFVKRRVSIANLIAIERPMLPRILSGPDAFYGQDGRLLPAFRVHMELQSPVCARPA